MAAKKILMLVGDYVEDYEAMVPLQILLMVGHHVDTVCPGKQPGDRVRTAVHDFDGDRDLQREAGHNFAITADFDAVVPAAYDALVIPGGRRARISATGRPRAGRRAALRRNAQADRRRLSWHADPHRGRRGGRPPLDRLSGLRPDLVGCGATWVEVGEGLTDAVVDGNLVTAAAWPGHPQWMRKFLEVLGSRIEA